MTTKQEKLNRLCDKNGIIGALAIDQRGALRRMLGEDTPVAELENFKVLVVIPRLLLFYMISL